MTIRELLNKLDEYWIDATNGVLDMELSLAVGIIVIILFYYFWIKNALK
jgi:hypothetical protein